MQRQKWICGSPNLSIGDVVFYVDTPLVAVGRVIEIHPDQDGIVRVVS